MRMPTKAWMSSSRLPSSRAQLLQPRVLFVKLDLSHNCLPSTVDILLVEDETWKLYESLGSATIGRNSNDSGRSEPLQASYRLLNLELNSP